MNASSYVYQWLVMSTANITRVGGSVGHIQNISAKRDVKGFATSVV